MNPIEPSENKIKELISLFDKKKFDELLKLSNELLDNFPKSILLHNIQGVIHTELKNYKLAKNLFIKVVNLSPNYTDGHYNLANVYNKLDDKEKAEFLHSIDAVKILWDAASKIDPDLTK